MLTSVPHKSGKTQLMCFPGPGPVAWGKPNTINVLVYNCTADALSSFGLDHTPSAQSLTHVPNMLEADSDRDARGTRK